MILAIGLGAIAGIGALGVFIGLRTSPPTLEAIVGTLNRSAGATSPRGEPPGISQRVGRAVTVWVGGSSLSADPRAAVLSSNLAVTGRSPETLAFQVVVGGGLGLLVPPLLWIVCQVAGVGVPLAVPAASSLLFVGVGMCWPIVVLFGDAKRRRRHFRTVVATFVDMVVLGLAGGVGVEGALFAASQVSPDWAARRLATALLGARESGRSPWAALGQLGEELGVAELIELSSTLQLAGTEGARIRQSLSARATSLRRHEQAEEESAANAMTERLFLPGALLLTGFLVFIGYPAFSRILGGF
ncbi:MAG TPA: type II secretion system F family protein [Acidimicrobiales bacterium]|nr:type II secretion system F family protein [Acidimicrobiales bacterium]